MRNLFLFIRRFYPFFLFLFLEIVSVFLISQSNSFQRATFVNSSNRVSGSFYQRRHNIKEYFGLREVNDLLEEENSLLRRQLSNMRMLADSGFVDTASTVIYNFIPATVINHSSQKKRNSFTLDLGSNSGLEDGMGVIDSRGLVGMITDVSSNYAVGISMLNTKTHISVKHKRSGAIGIMRWRGNDPLEHIMEDVTKTAGVRTGDTIVTSGYSTYFPEGLQVAVVVNAVVKEGSNFYDITTRLTNDILSLNKVYVIRHDQRVEIDSLEQVIQ